MPRFFVPLVFAVAIASCDSDVSSTSKPDSQPPLEFGTVAVQIDGTRWFILRARASVGGWFDPQIAQLMIQAPNQGVPGYRELISARICAAPTVRAYSFAAPGLAIAATWITPGQATGPHGGSGDAV